ncbi:MAG: tetratricopeptide repeat protein [Deltaproteobacteria bacterium]|nr:tetratricopeptide repeat protein [Deltaproteobacteria bacterium]
MSEMVTQEPSDATGATEAEGSMRADDVTMAAAQSLSGADAAEDDAVAFVEDEDVAAVGSAGDDVAYGAADSASAQPVEAIDEVEEIDEIDEIESPADHNEPNDVRGVPPQSAADASPSETASEESPESAFEALLRLYQDETNARPDPSASGRLLAEMGRIEEEHFKDPERAAAYFALALSTSPTDLTVIQAQLRAQLTQGDWAGALATLDAEIAATTDDTRRSQLFAEKGSVLEHRLRRPEEAAEAYRNALALRAGEPFALHSLERIDATIRDQGALGEFYQNALSVTPQAEFKIPILLARAKLALERSGDPDDAIAALEDVLEINPTHEEALSQLQVLFRTTNRFDDLTRILIASARATDSDRLASSWLMSASRLQRDHKGDLEAALSSLLEAEGRTPDDVYLLHEVENVCELLARYDDALMALDRQINLVEEPKEKASLLHRFGSILETKLERNDDAIAAYRRAIDLHTNCVPAIQSLGRILERTEQWPELAELYKLELERDTDVGHRVTALYKLADIYATKLGRADLAVDTLRLILESDPTYSVAFDALERLLKRHDQWADLLELHYWRSRQASTREQQIFHLLQVGQIAEDRLNSLERAISAYEEVVKLDAQSLEAVRYLTSLNERLGRWDAVADSLEIEANALGASESAAGVWHRIGDIREQRLEDDQGAIEAYQRSLAISPTYLPVLRSLGKLCRRKGLWSDLVLMCRRELEVVESAEHRVSVLFNIAEVLVNELGDNEAAINAYEEILTIEPASASALDALAELHLRAQDHERLVFTLLRSIQVMGSDSNRARTMQSVAEVLEFELDDTDRAAEVYREIIASGVGTELAIEGLARIYAQTGRHQELVNVLQVAASCTASDRAKILALSRAAQVAEDDLGDLDIAAACLEEALVLAPESVRVLSQLEHVLVDRRSWPRLVAISERLADLDQNPEAFAARHLRIALIKESELTPPAPAIANYRAVLGRIPDHPIALRGLETAYRAQGAWADLLNLYVDQASSSSGATERAQLLFLAGELAELALGDARRADTLYISALDSVPDHLPAIEARARLARQRDDAETLLACTLAESRIVADEARGTALLFKAGTIQEDAFQNFEAASKLYRTVRTRSPGHLGAFLRLRNAFQRRSDHASLVELLTEQAAVTESVAEQVELLFAAARSAEVGLQDPEEARNLYRQVLAREPNDARALRQLGPLLFSVARWEESRDTFHHLTECTQEDAVIAYAYRNLGIIYQDHLANHDLAVDAFERAIAADPEDTESLARVARAYESVEDWPSVISRLQRLADVSREPQARTATLLELGRVFEDGAQDLASAVAAVTQALEVDAWNRGTMIRLIDLHEKTENWGDAAATLNLLTRSFQANEKLDAVPWLVRLALIYETYLGDEARALQELSTALEADELNLPALEAMARLSERNPALNEQAILMHRRLLDLNPFRADSHHALHTAFMRKNALDEAFVTCEILMFMRSYTVEEDEFYREFKDQIPPHPSKPLSAEEHLKYVIHPDEQGVARTLLEILARDAHALIPGSLDRYEMHPRQDRHGSRSQFALRRFVDDVAKILGAPAFDLWISQKLDRGVAIESRNPPAIIAGDQVARRVQEKEQRFLFGRALEQIIGGHGFLALPDLDLVLLVGAAARIARPGIPVNAPADLLEAKEKWLRSTLSRATRKALEQLDVKHAPLVFDVDRHRRAATFTGNRAGLLCANDVEVALRTLSREAGAARTVFKDAEAAAEMLNQSPEVLDLLSFASGELYAEARKELGFALEA